MEVEAAQTEARSSNRRSQASRLAILAGTAKALNQGQADSVTIAGIAQSIGVARATAYYHFRDREDLIFECFRRSLAHDATLLHDASEADSGLPQVVTYLQSSIKASDPETAIVIDPSAMAPERRTVLEDLLKANYVALEGMIRAGIACGNIRECDAQIVARVLPSMVRFCLLAPRWAGARRGKPDSKAFVDFVSFGSASDRSARLDIIPRVEDFFPNGFPGLGRQQIADIRVEQILMISSQMLNRLGPQRLSLDDVARELGMTRGVIYHYFRDRDELLARCLDRGMALFNAFIDYALDHGRNGLEQSLIVSHLNTQAQAGPLQPVMTWLGLNALSQDDRGSYHAKVRQVQQRSEMIALAGFEDGSRRRAPTATESIARAGAYNWLPSWIAQIERPSPVRLANEINALFAAGLAPIGTVQPAR